MRVQRDRVAENRTEMQIAKWTAEGAWKSFSLVLCDVRHTSVARDMIVSRKEHVNYVKLGGTADYIQPVLDRFLVGICQGRVF